MHTGHRYGLWQTIRWSQSNFLYPLAWATVVTAVYELGDLHWIGLPTLPMSLVGIAVAFYLGLANDVPISSMARGIERDVREMIGQTELPAAREPSGQIIY